MSETQRCDGAAVQPRANRKGSPVHPNLETYFILDKNESHVNVK